jgi:uncharacterized protein (TIGR00299 family) protein
MSAGDDGGWRKGFVSKLLYFDCFSGASGDMVLGALLDAGLPLAALREALGSLAIEGYELTATRTLRAGVSATKFGVVEKGHGHAHHDEHDDGHAHERRERHGHHERHEPHGHRHDEEQGHSHSHEHGHTHEPHAHEHGHGHQPGHAHRSLREIEALIARSALSSAARDRAIGLFRRLAEAEAAIHDMPVEEVHLHEVGALDSIIDIVGGVFGIEWFGADRIVASALNTGSGMVQCAHGRFPVPAPATARLVAGVPVYASGPAVELLTPTGALLVTGYAESYGPLPSMTIDRIGYGAGDRDFSSTPNVLRVLVGSAAAVDEAGGAEGERPEGERVVVLECEIDDMNPQLYGVLLDRLLAAGALDVFFAPVQMKKNRPGTLVTVLALPGGRAALSSIIFSETTTLGLRYHDVLRERLEREQIEVATPWGAVRMKVARRAGQVMNAAPEFDDCVRVAQAGGVAVKDVQAAAVHAFLGRRAQA